MNTNLNLDVMTRAIRSSAQQMDSQCGNTVFDEWVVVVASPQPRILNYFGPRNYRFRQNFFQRPRFTARGAAQRQSQRRRFRVRAPRHGLWALRVSWHWARAFI